MSNILVPLMIPILARWETFQPEPYRDNDGTWHQAYGHGNANNYPPFVHEHSPPITEPEAMKILIGELSEVYIPQVTKLFQKIDFKPNDYYFSGTVDVVYNRGIGRYAGADVVSIDYAKGSYAWHILKNEQNVPNFRGQYDFKERAAIALIKSHVDDFVPLDVAKDKITGIPRVHLGLELRRAADCTLCTWIR